MNRTNILAGLLLGLATSAGALPPPAATPVETRRHALDEQALRIDTLDREVERLRNRVADLRTRPDLALVDAGEVEEARAAQAAVEIEWQSVELDQQASQRAARVLGEAVEQEEKRLKALRALTDPTPEQRRFLGEVQTTLGDKKTQLALELRQHDQLSRKAELLKEKLQISREHHALLNERFESSLTAQREGALVDMERRTHQEQQRLLGLSARLNEQLGALGNPTRARPERSVLQTQIKEAEESIYLLGARLQAEKAVYTLRQGERLKDDEDDIERLAARLQAMEKLVAEFTAAEALTRGKLDVLRQTQDVLHTRPSSPAARATLPREQQIIARLAEQFAQQLAAQQDILAQTKTRLAEIAQRHAASVKRGLTARHSLPSSLTEWGEVLRELFNLPGTLWQFALNTLGEIAAGLGHAPLLRWLGALGVSLAGFALWWPIHKRAAGGTARSASSFSGRMLGLALAVFGHNRISFLAAMTLLPALWLLDLKADAVLTLTLAFTLWLGARLPLCLAWQILCGPHALPAAWQTSLYRILSTFVLLGVLLALFMLLGEAGVLSASLHEMSERAFLLLFAVAFFALLRAGSGITGRLGHTPIPRRWLGGAVLAGTLFLCSMLGAALLGVAGYINLAWSVAEHLAWLLLVAAGGYLAQGFLNDGAAWLSARALRDGPAGRPWVQDVIEPLHQLLHLALIPAAAWVLLEIYGRRAGPAFADALHHGLHSPLFQVGEQNFDAWRLLESALFLVVLTGLTRWVRKFSFRWLFAGIHDIGVRNSLSAFTQYSVFLLGVILALKLLGLDLTHVAIFTGAVGVGIGLGMQNLANNFISGIILLLERPLRAHDLVTIGQVEGEVRDIGIRSVTVRTADNQEVIIPNADLISRPLINWTRNDRVLRTVLHLTLDLKAGPHAARRVLDEVVRADPDVLADPQPCVWLHEITPQGMDFQLEYFTDTARSGRLEVRSRVLMAAWDALSAAAIALAHPATSESAHSPRSTAPPGPHAAS